MICLEHLILFHLLDYCWEAYDLNDDLPALLGEMSPYLFSNETPIDTAVYDNWDNICLNIMDYRDRLERVGQLLVSLENKYHFYFGETKKVLTRISENDVARIINYCNRVQDLSV